MDQQHQDLSSGDCTTSAPGPKRHKHLHEDDEPKMSKKLKEEITEPILCCSQDASVLSLNYEQNLKNSSILTEGNDGSTNGFKPQKLNAKADVSNASELEAGLDDVSPTSATRAEDNSSQNSVGSQNQALELPTNISPACNQSVFSSTLDNTEASLRVVDLQNLQSHRKGFWEALKVHVERPHILNRRLCGVVDVWWGRCSWPESGKMYKKAVPVGNLQDLPCKGQDAESLDPAKVSLGDSFLHLFRDAWKILNPGRDSVVPLQNEDSISNALLKNDLKLTSMEGEVISVLVGKGFKVFGTEEPLVEACTALESGSRGCYVVVRRVLPKLQERYASVTEVVIMDGTSNSCCFLSEATVPPLLPSRPYVISCRDYPATGDSSERSDVDSVLQGTARPHGGLYNVAGATLPDDGDAMPDAGAAVPDAGAAVPDAGAALLDAGAAVPYVASALPDASTSAAYDCGAAPNAFAGGNTSVNDNSSQKPLSLNPCGIFQCFFIAGICEGSDGDSSKGDGRVWLESSVLPRLQKWALPRESQEPPTRSLQLVDLQSYGVMYHNLKSKYAAHLIQSWSERTDPKKFVHEDIGIATYLLLLWSERSRPQRFVDLGCGNGLLVYILTKEGHVGAGYDIKRRNIWHERFSDIDLQEREVRPDSTTFSADVDWLIGNHSDELTPWLPVMAARCSQSCSFFLLPCCPHDFTTKFLRRNTKKSQYGDYLDYVSEVGRVCGFEMERDRLKIPSTKRECFVGRSRLYSEQDRSAVLSDMQQFIDARVAQCGRKVSCETKKGLATGNQRGNKEELVSLGEKSDSVGAQPKSTQFNGSESAFIGRKEGDVLSRNDNIPTEPEQEVTSLNGGESSFTVRPKEQRVRNCTQLAKGVKEDLVKCVVDFLLQGIDVKTEEWSQGACTELRSAAGMLRPDQLRQIKQECGGLKTLLKNHRHIFLVEGSTVRLRVPGRVPEFEKRQRPCWFSVHHPQGCPNAAADCMYSH